MDTDSESEEIISLSDFRMKWCWQHIPGYPNLPIQPMWDSIGDRLWKLTRALTSKHGDRRPFAEKFGVIATISDEIEPRIVEQWFRNLIPSDNDRVFVSWESPDAVLTTVDFFCRYWDTFINPRGDVLVMAVTGEWIVHFWPEGIMYFSVLIEKARLRIPQISEHDFL